MGFSAEQLARWVAERTDVNVGGLFYVLNLEEIYYFFNTVLYHHFRARCYHTCVSITLKTQTAKDIFLLTET